jgi:8-oxo-dGTP diphosphatase
VAVPSIPEVLARGPWSPEQVQAVWSHQQYEPAAAATAAADAALQALRDRGSPSHDGLAARLADFAASPGRLVLELQPARWALRLLADQAARSLAVLCLVRSADGSWLAGRRAPWLASWPGRWALGAGGSVEVGEDPVAAMARELLEEWSVRADRLSVEALVLLPSQLAMLVGQAWLAPGISVRPDAEHDEFDWWPADVERWPRQADEPLRRMAALLAAGP